MAKRDANGKNPAVVVAAAAAGKSEAGKVFTLTTGVKVKIEPVSAGLIQTVMGKIKDPKVPIEYDKERDREMSNPLHPDYLAAVERANVERMMAGNDAMIMFGLKLIDDMPPVEEWGPKLKFLGLDFDENNPIEAEFMYKKHIAMGGASDMMLLSTSAGISEEAVAEAVGAFQRQKG